MAVPTAVGFTIQFTTIVILMIARPTRDKTTGTILTRHLPSIRKGTRVAVLTAVILVIQFAGIEISMIPLMAR